MRGGGGEMKRRRTEKKMRDHFWSIFQGKEKASTPPFENRRVTGSEKAAAAKLRQAAVCRLTLGEKDGIKGREGNE